MALVTFKCRACGPFMMFSDSAKEIFKILNIPMSSSGVLRNDKLPVILETIEKAYRDNKEKVEELTHQIEQDMRSSNIDEEEKLSQTLKSFQERVHLFQRLFPLQDMIRRAIKHGDHVLWEMS